MKESKSGIERYKQERRLQAEARKKHVLDTAERLFFQKGIANVSMNEVMRESGVSKATLYRYYQNIHEIAFELEYMMAQKILVPMNDIKIEGRSFQQIGLDTNLFLIDNFYKLKEELLYIGMFDNMYSFQYPSDELENEYLNVLHNYEARFDEYIKSISQDKIDKLTTTINVTLSFLYRLASRGKLLEKEQGVSVDIQLKEYRNMIIREFGDKENLL